jgi:hypothetical protein
MSSFAPGDRCTSRESSASANEAAVTWKKSLNAGGGLTERQQAIRQRGCKPMRSERVPLLFLRLTHANGLFLRTRRN